MQIDPNDLDKKERYFLMTAAVVPRPIGWASTRSASGVVNLAPFSFFNACSTEPPIVMLAVGRRRGERKDTARNLLETKEAVVHIPHRPLAEAMVATSAGVGPEVEEMSLADLTPEPSVKVSVPRVKEAAIAMEAKLIAHHEVGDLPTDVFLLECVHFHLDDRYLTDGLPDPGKLQAVGRLGGIRYCDTSEVFEIEGPPR